MQDLIISFFFVLKHFLAYYCIENYPVNRQCTYLLFKESLHEVAKTHTIWKARELESLE